MVSIAYAPHTMEMKVFPPLNKKITPSSSHFTLFSMMFGEKRNEKRKSLTQNATLRVVCLSVCVCLLQTCVITVLHNIILVFSFIKNAIISP